MGLVFIYFSCSLYKCTKSKQSLTVSHRAPNGVLHKKSTSFFNYNYFSFTFVECITGEECCVNKIEIYSYVKVAVIFLSFVFLLRGNYKAVSC